MKRRKQITGKERINQIEREILPLDQREKPLNTRKGMTRQRETVNINFLEYQSKIDEFENLI